MFLKHILDGVKDSSTCDIRKGCSRYLGSTRLLPLVMEQKKSRSGVYETALVTTDTSCESVVTSCQQHLSPQHPPRDASPTGLLSIAEETLIEFLSKATGTAVEWVQMPGMKPGPDSIRIIAISHGCTGVASRACGLVGLEPTRVAEILKDRPSWYRDCRAVDVLNVLTTGTNRTIELLYMQLYAPTTLAPARDFWLLRYTSALEDGSLVVCESSLNNTQNGPSMPPVPHFVRAKMMPSGYLIRPCDGGGSIIHIVDHIDFESGSIPEVLRPLYESSTLLAQRTTLAVIPNKLFCITGCPKELQVVGGDGGSGAPGGVIACNSACGAFNIDQYCCIGQYANPNTCKPSYYSSIFKRACPRAYSYAFDDGTITFTCNAYEYAIIFCPNSNKNGMEQTPQPGPLITPAMKTRKKGNTTSNSMLQVPASICLLLVLFLSLYLVHM